MRDVKDGRYAWTAKVGEKGQIVIPKEARDIFGIKPGDTLILFGDPEKGRLFSGVDAYALISV